MSVDVLDHHIAGTKHASASGERLPVVDPATGAQVATQAAGDLADVAAAVAAAQQATAAWQALGTAGRGRALTRWADLIDAEAAALAELDVTDTGKPYAVAAGSVGRAADMLRWYAGWAQTVPRQGVGRISLT
ncbi:MAG: aldehyde dehydrogenase family protein [Streptosporangiales bacterium]|nr:aldehyde dehydrogenase family protein [Streptosporangiales bacterium]